MFRSMRAGGETATVNSGTDGKQAARSSNMSVSLRLNMICSVFCMRSHGLQCAGVQCVGVYADGRLTGAKLVLSEEFGITVTNGHVIGKGRSLRTL